MWRVVSIGGGGGQSAILKDLKREPEVEITGVVPATDSGGSTRDIFKAYGRRYEMNGCIGDLTKVCCALCPDEELARILMFRFNSGPFDGHSVKNIIFSSACAEYGLNSATELMRRLFQTGRHRVLPVSDKTATLIAYTEDGCRISGESILDKISLNPLWDPIHHKITKIKLSRKIVCLPEVEKAIAIAHYIIIPPGDLFTSTIPILLVDGIKESFSRSGAKIIAVINLMTKKGETDGYGLKDFVEQIETRIGRQVDRIICNNGKIPAEILSRYEKEKKVAQVFNGDESVAGEFSSRLRKHDLWTLDSKRHVVHDSKKTTTALMQVFRELR